MTVAKCENAAPYCHRVHAVFVKATLAVDGSVGTGWWRAARLLSVARYPTFQTRAVSPHGSLICNRIQHDRAQGPTRADKEKKEQCRCERPRDLPALRPTTPATERRPSCAPTPAAGPNPGPHTTPRHRKETAVGTTGRT